MTDPERSQTDWLEDAPEEGGGEEPWLVSYADLMTLLFGFFAMLFTFASFNEDADKFIKVRKELMKYFGLTYVTDVEKLGKEVGKAIEKLPGLGQMDMRQEEDGLTINIRSEFLFRSASSELAQGADALLTELAQSLKLESDRLRISVEGHTDDNPSRMAVFPSNWELSAARAAAVVRVFERAGVSPAVLGAIGYGETRPVFPNRDRDGRPIPVNQSLNRRVAIKVKFGTKNESALEENLRATKSKDADKSSGP